MTSVLGIIFSSLAIYSAWHSDFYGATLFVTGGIFFAYMQAFDRSINGRPL